MKFIQLHFGETVLTDLCIAVGIFAAVYFALWLIKHHMLVRLEASVKKSKSKLDDVILNALKGVGNVFMSVLALFMASRHLQLPEIVTFWLYLIFLFALVYETIKITERFIVFFFTKTVSKKDQKSIAGAVVVVVRIVLWTIGLMLILSNLGFNVNSLIASLGVGGLAVSLALQNVFTDIFSSFSIVLDKPFEVGDYIIVGEHEGTVKHIGLKTTRIEALQGEEIVVSNTELTTTRIRNYKKMQHRRVSFTLGLVYGTPVTKLKMVPKIMKEIITKEKNADFDRAHFKSYGDFSLNFEVVFYVKNSEYKTFMDAQQRINYAIAAAFKKEGIEMAFPTQTIFVEKNEE